MLYFPFQLYASKTFFKKGDIHIFKIQHNSSTSLSIVLAGHWLVGTGHMERVQSGLFLKGDAEARARKTLWNTLLQIRILCKLLLSTSVFKDWSARGLKQELLTEGVTSRRSLREELMIYTLVLENQAHPPEMNTITSLLQIIYRNTS